MHLSVMLKCALIVINPLQQGDCICVAGDVTHWLFLVWWKDRQKISALRGLMKILKNLWKSFIRLFSWIGWYFLAQIYLIRMYLVLHKISSLVTKLEYLQM